MKKSNILQALSTSALAIPTLTSAGSMPDAAEIGYLVSSYNEDSIEAQQSVDNKEHDRYNIAINQFHLLTPISDNETISIDFIHDTMSGASPWAVSTKNNDSDVIMSGASIKETRKDTRVAYKKYEQFRTQSITVAHSTENDYNSLAVGGDLELTLTDKNTVISVGGSISDDEITPTVGKFVNLRDGIVKDSKNTYSMYGSVTRVLSRSTILQAGTSLSIHKGYLSDPYKMNDKRPKSRFMTTTSAKIVHHLAKHDSALHFDYRFYKDDWSVRSDTFSLSIYKNMQDNYQIVPSVRYYSQDKASFYNTETSTIIFNENYSDDYRLSKYGAISAGFKIIKRFSDLTIHGSIERYNTDNGFAIGSNLKSNPGLVDFTRISMGFEYKF